MPYSLASGLPEFGSLAGWLRDDIQLFVESYFMRVGEE
jgi:hypothetical protein